MESMYIVLIFNSLVKIGYKFIVLVNMKWFFF